VDSRRGLEQPCHGDDPATGNQEVVGRSDDAKKARHLDIHGSEHAGRVDIPNATTQFRPCRMHDDPHIAFDLGRYLTDALAVRQINGPDATPLITVSGKSENPEASLGQHRGYRSSDRTGRPRYYRPFVGHESSLLMRQCQNIEN